MMAPDRSISGGLPTIQVALLVAPIVERAEISVTASETAWRRTSDKDARLCGVMFSFHPEGCEAEHRSLGAVGTLETGNFGDLFEAMHRMQEIDSFFNGLALRSHHRWFVAQSVEEQAKLQSVFRDQVHRKKRGPRRGASSIVQMRGTALNVSRRVEAAAVQLGASVDIARPIGTDELATGGALSWIFERLDQEPGRLRHDDADLLSQALWLRQLLLSARMSHSSSFKVWRDGFESEPDLNPIPSAALLPKGLKPKDECDRVAHLLDRLPQWDVQDALMSGISHTSRRRIALNLGLPTDSEHGWWSDFSPDEIARAAGAAVRVSGAADKARVTTAVIEVQRVWRWLVGEPNRGGIHTRCAQLLEDLEKRFELELPADALRKDRRRKQLD